MPSFIRLTLIGLGLLGAILACVNEYDPAIRANVNVVIVEATLTDLPETQFVKLSRSKSDSINGRFGSVPLTGATVTITEDSSRVLALKETAGGRYELPAEFRGRVGSRYQLRFQLRDGTRYESSTETLRAGPAIAKIYDAFNARSLPESLLKGYTAANDIFVDTPDPANVPNFYRWEWKLWERQDWCVAGQYVDTPCASTCWEILYSYSNAVFADTYTDGRTIVGRRVAQIPYHQDRPALVEVRQSSLTPLAYRYFKLFSDQTESTGTLTDTPPSALVGNIRNLADERESVVGYFVVSSVARVYYWLERKSNVGPPIGLFVALHGRKPITAGYVVSPSPCLPDENRTPFKPEGWRE